MSYINLKVVIIGDSGVGKSTLAYAMSTEDGICTKNIDSTVGSGYIRATMRGPISGMIGFDIWDTAGQERYRSLGPMYIRGANVVIFVIDDTSESLISIADFWQPYTKSIVGSQGLSPMYLLIRNKCDKSGSNELEIINYSTRMQYDVLRTSATTGIGTLQVLRTIIRKMYGYGPTDGIWDQGRISPPTTVVRLGPPDTEPVVPSGCRC